MFTRPLIVCGLWLIVSLSAVPRLLAVQAVPDLRSLQALLDAGKDLEAEQDALARVAAIERDRGPDAGEIALLLDLVLEARLSVRRVANTAGSADLAERALRIKEKAYGPDDPRVADTLVLAAFARRDGKSRLAAVERAVAIYERTLGPGGESLALARALHTLAWVHWQARHMLLAIQTAERALAMARRLESPPGRETASALNTLAGSRRTNGEIDESVPLYEEALSIEEQMRGTGHPANTFTMIGFAAALFDVGELDRGRALSERAIEILEHTPGSERRLAFEMISLANSLETYGDYSAAFAMCERGVAVAERATGANSAVTLAGLGKLGTLHQRLGDHAAAAAIRARTLERWTALQGAESLHVATALIELAASYESAGDIDKAFETLDRAMKMKALADQPIVHADGFELLGSLLMRRGRLAEARTALERAHAMDAASKHDSGRRGQAATLRLLGRLERQEGQAARAIPLYRDAVQLLEREFGPASINTAEVRTELAEALAEAGLLDEARKTLVASETASLDHLRLIARALPDRRALAFAAERRSGIDLAVTLAARSVPAAGDVDMALQMLIQGRSVVLDEMASRQRTVIAEAENAVVRERWNVLNRARARLANLIVRGAEGAQLVPHQALVERTRAERDRAERDLAQVSASFQREQRRSQAGVRDVLARLPEGAVLVSYVRYTPRRLADAASGGGARTQTPGTSGATPQGARVIDAPGQATAHDPATGTTGAAAYAAFVGRAGGPLRVMALGSAEVIETAIATWRNRIQAELTSAGLASRRTEAAYRDAGAALRALLWDPISKHLGTARTAFIVPDGAIHLVDLSTLPTGRTGYLIDSALALHYLLAERDLVQPSPEPHGRSLLALGAPDFDKVDRAAVEALTSPAAMAGERATATIALAAPNPTLGGQLRQVRSACEALMGRRFEPLPATRQEMQRIAQLWRQGSMNNRRQVTGGSADAAGNASADAGADVLLLGDDRASESAFKALARGRRVLHLATHGFFLDRFCGANPTDTDVNTTTTTNTNPESTTNASSATGADTIRGNGTRAAVPRVLEENPLLRSGLVLAGANRQASAAQQSHTVTPPQATLDEDDGILTAEEIAGLDLTAAQWAVLSACDTGRGDWQAGEGVLGLRRAFEVAGARTVIISLWPVIDRVASDWMAELYRGKFVGGLTTANAVRRASRTLLASRRASKASTHPLYWSGFIATGDWR